MATNSTPPPSTSLQWMPTLNAAAEAVINTLDEAIAVLEAAGERSAAIVLRREFQRWPADHVCSFVDGECDCGASR